MKRFLFSSLLVFGVGTGYADVVTSTPTAYSPHDFVRSIDVAAYGQLAGHPATGVQTLRLKSRFVDPDVHAFVGTLFSLTRFSKGFPIGEDVKRERVDLFGNGGLNFGIQKGRTFYELDVMAALSNSTFAPAVALGIERPLFERWYAHVRAEANFFPRDTVADGEAQLQWEAWDGIFIATGYRLFAAKHASRNGPFLGLHFRWESPKIPFLFPSLG